MSNVIKMAVEALEFVLDHPFAAVHMGPIPHRERLETEAKAHAALAELRRYEVVEGCAVDEGVMMVYYDFPAEGSDEAPAILLVQKEQP